MDWGGMKKYTWKELSYFQWEDLMLGELEFLKQANQKEEIPKEIVDKIKASVSELAESIPEISISFPSDKKTWTREDVFKILEFCLSVRSFLDFATKDYSLIKPVVLEIIGLLKQIN